MHAFSQWRREAWRCNALALALARLTETTVALLASRPRRCAHVRSPHRCEFMLLRRAIDCCPTQELLSLDFFSTSPNAPRSRMLFGSALALFVLKSSSADWPADAGCGVGAESAGNAVQHLLPHLLQLTLCGMSIGQ